MRLVHGTCGDCTSSKTTIKLLLQICMMRLLYFPIRFWSTHKTLALLKDIDS